MSLPYSTGPAPPAPPHPPLPPISSSYTPDVLPAYQPPPRPPKPSSPSPHRPGSTASQAQNIAPPPGPPIDESFLPPGLEQKSLSDLKHLLSNPSLLQALYKTTHPTAKHLDNVLQSTLSATESHAARLLALESTLAAQRTQTSARLAESKSLEAHWRTKEAEMYRELKRWSEVGLYGRLVNAVNESEETAEAMEQSFLAGGEGKMEEFVKEYLKERKKGHLRRERKWRWDEGRIGGWR